MAERRGVAGTVLEELEIAKPEAGRLRGGAVPGRRGRKVARGLSPQAAAARAHELWRVAQGSRAAVLKKIARGGAHTARELGRQVDYLFSKSEGIFGNMVEHDPEARSLSPDERKALIADWSDGWAGAAKNGHTTHLLMSFPADVRPDTARTIAELWAFEMFQSGDHQDEEWAYVAALHTDRAHPHVHIVLNNRGLMSGAWFFMARDHVFNFQMMKQRMVAIAAEQGVFLDASSRLDRGILTYGPSRAEIERARAEGRAPVEKRREGPALEAALAEVAQSGETLRFLARLAALTGERALQARIEAAVDTLRAGGILHPFSRLPLSGESDMTLPPRATGWCAPCP
ncbi:relaxase/mobilization nuclease domain-containing protein [Rhodovulum strictum]|uniref:Relaxase/mobilization nuclease domain-containing protein n=1 Tax=Rhodovulum strictum TaxID=58314 RepID=A0A844BJZ9_9RHOB|nr:relaxase/mobilization nuclease domain-containing protein [Rhodovulum strictum]MRH22869.1 relaxase/mobilization nuclease domain-containing protein [Rhodovulum strictum]